MLCIDKIRQLLNEGKPTEAIELLTPMIEGGSEAEAPADMLYYLRGNAHRQMSLWQLATNDYLEAIAINPDSPAVEAYEMMISIYNFFNKDMYNQ